MAADEHDLAESAEPVRAELEQRMDEQRPTAAEREALLDEHEHHLVRDATGTKTIEDGPLGVEFTMEAEDVYCFTCGEWVGITGADLPGTPRSKVDAYWLRGPPDDVAEARTIVRGKLDRLAATVRENVDHIDTHADAVEFVIDQADHLGDA